MYGCWIQKKLTEMEKKWKGKKIGKEKKQTIIAHAHKRRSKEEKKACTHFYIQKTNNTKNKHSPQVTI